MTRVVAIVAGSDSLCNTYAVKSDTVCSNINLSSFINATKDIYSQVGIEIEIAEISTEYRNFNRYDSNGNYPNSHYQLPNYEVNYIANQLSPPSLPSDTVLVIGVPDLVKLKNGSWVSSAGIAKAGENYCAIGQTEAVPATMAHEIGHAKYSLQHPKDEFGICDPDNLLFYTNSIPPGAPDTCSTGLQINRSSKFRHYQWKEIHEKH